MSDAEKVTGLTSDKILGYFETIRSVAYVKLATISWLEEGDVAKHRDLSKRASEIAKTVGDELATKILRTITTEVVDNLKEEIVTTALVSAWNVFELVIKDLTAPNYVLQPNKLNADFYNNLLGFSVAEKDEIALFYHIRNAVLHYNGAYHAYKTVDVTYHGKHFKSEGHFGEKIDASFDLAMHIVKDLEAYAMQAWCHLGRD